MFKELCATLLLLCSSVINDFDFEYKKDDHYTFVSGIADCTVNFNAVLPPMHRVVVVISVAQAVIESNWGESRFAREANNFYGIIQTDKTEPHIKSLRGTALLKVYGNKCESVGDYIKLLNNSEYFQEYRDIRMKQVITGEVDIFRVIKSLDSYATDPKYRGKVKDIVNSLLEDYPLLFNP